MFLNGLHWMLLYGHEKEHAGTALCFPVPLPHPEAPFAGTAGLGYTASERLGGGSHKADAVALFYRRAGREEK
jgi:hypothetical protein